MESRIKLNLVAYLPTQLWLDTTSSPWAMRTWDSSGSILMILTLLKYSTNYVKCNLRVVQNIISNYNFNIFQRCSQWQDYKRKTIAYEDWYIKHILKQNEFLSLNDIINIINQNISFISIKILLYRYSEMNLRNYIVIKKFDLYKENIILYL